MSDKEIIYQMIEREISNFMMKNVPGLQPFSKMLTNYAIKLVDPYVDAFLTGDGELNLNAAEHYLKDETNRKIDEYMNRFKETKDKQ